MAELRTFLTEALVPLRLGCHHSRDGLWMVSLWYDYEDGLFRCATGRKSDLASFLRKNSAVSFEVSTNRPPYMGVRGNGTASLESDPNKELLRSLLERYFGGTESELADQLLSDEREELTVTIEPDRLYTWDFTSRMDADLDSFSAATAPEPESPVDRD